MSTHHTLDNLKIVGAFILFIMAFVWIFIFILGIMTVMDRKGMVKESYDERLEREQFG